MKDLIGMFVALSLTTTLASAPALILTDLINQGKIQEARTASLVNPALFLNVTSHSGFFTIDKKYNSNTFFWYFPVADKPVNETPWIIWLQGGPGASSLAGLFDEIGPFEYDTELKLRQWSWAKNYSMLFIDNPVGSGYSFTDHDDGFVQDMETCSSHLYNAILQFLAVFPELRKAPLYIAGESYAGRYLPALGMKILQQDRSIGPLDVNLQGIIMGNPVLNRDNIADYSSIYYQWGLIDSQGRLAVKKLQDAYNAAVKEKNATQAVLLREELLDKLNDMSMQQQTFNVLEDDISSKLRGFESFIKRDDVKEALHVGPLQFSFSNGTVHQKLVNDFMSEVRSKVEVLLDRYRILIYCGQLDLTAPCVPTAQARRKYWQWNHREDFLRAARMPWWHNNSVAGYVKSGGNLTEALVRGAGHLVPMDKPEQTLELIQAFIQGSQVRLPPRYHLISDDTPEYRAEDDIETEVAKFTILPPGYENDGVKTGMVISIVLNVILILTIAAGVFLTLRWKRRTEAYMYNSVDETCIVSSTMF